MLSYNIYSSLLKQIPIIGTCIFPLFAQSQTNYHTRQFSENFGSINPAAYAITQYKTFSIHHISNIHTSRDYITNNSLWTNLKNEKIKSDFAVKLESEILSDLTIQSIQFSYAYTIRLQKITLSMGIQEYINAETYIPGNIHIKDINDPMLEQTSSVNVHTTTGICIYNSMFSIGFAIQQIGQFSTIPQKEKRALHYTVHGKYLLSHNTKNTLAAMFVLETTANKNLYSDFLAEFTQSQKYSVALGINNNISPVIICGINLQNGLSTQNSIWCKYSTDFRTTTSPNYIAQHELSIVVLFAPKPTPEKIRKKGTAVSPITF